MTNIDLGTPGVSVANNQPEPEPVNNPWSNLKKLNCGIIADDNLIEALEVQYQTNKEQEKESAQANEQGQRMAR
jgi:hypothetical protein